MNLIYIGKINSIRIFYILGYIQTSKLTLKLIILVYEIKQPTFKNKIHYEFAINPLHTVSLPGFTMQCGLKYSNMKLQTLQDK